LAGTAKAATLAASAPGTTVMRTVGASPPLLQTSDPREVRTGSDPRTTGEACHRPARPSRRSQDRSLTSTGRPPA
jgi:hypothetical protein